MTMGAGLVGGIVLWTLLEYVLHRWVFHERVLGNRLSRDHLKHHAKVDWFVPFRIKALIATVVVGVLLALSTLLAGTEIALSLVAGVITGWMIYEWIHRRIHVAPPVGIEWGKPGTLFSWYGLWARRHHLSHHFGNAKLNHGVSTPIWDLVFGTYMSPETVQVPRMHVAKFPWLLDRDRIAARFSDTYRIV